MLVKVLHPSSKAPMRIAVLDLFSAPKGDKQDVRLIEVSPKVAHPMYPVYLHDIECKLVSAHPYGFLSGTSVFFMEVMRVPIPLISTRKQELEVGDLGSDVSDNDESQ
jgi:hypothetical protein